MSELDPFDFCAERQDCLSYAETFEANAKDNAAIFDDDLHSRIDPLFSGEAPEPALVDLAVLQQNGIIDFLKNSPCVPCSQRCARYILLGKIVENRL